MNVELCEERADDADVLLGKGDGDECEETRWRGG